MPGLLRKMMLVLLLGCGILALGIVVLIRHTDITEHLLGVAAVLSGLAVLFIVIPEGR